MPKIKSPSMRSLTAFDVSRTTTAASRAIERTRDGRPIALTEAQLARQVADYLTVCLPRGVEWTHIASGGARDAAVAGKLKAEGVRPGAPDYVIVAPGIGVVWIELKSPGGRTTAAQEEWARAIRETPGCTYALCRSLAEVDATLRRAGLILKRVRV